MFKIILTLSVNTITKKNVKTLLFFFTLRWIKTRTVSFEEMFSDKRQEKNILLDLAKVRFHKDTQCSH